MNNLTNKKLKTLMIKYLNCMEFINFRQENLSMVTRDNEKFANILKERTSELENKRYLRV